MLKTTRVNYTDSWRLDDNVHMQNSIYLISNLKTRVRYLNSCYIPKDVIGGEGQKAAHSKNEANNFWLRNFFQKIEFDNPLCTLVMLFVILYGKKIL